MFLSDLAKDMTENMTENLCIKNGLDIQAFIYALEDGEVCGQLENLGYSQEDIERVHDELWKLKDELFDKS